MSAEGCRVHPGAPPVAVDLCGSCCHRLDVLRRRYNRLAPYTDLQVETLCGLGRPTTPMLDRWPHLKRWIAKARRERQAGRQPAPSPQPHTTPLCQNRTHIGEDSIPAAGAHDLCGRCRHLLSGLQYRTPKFPYTASAAVLRGTPPEILDRLAAAWKGGERLLDARRALADLDAVPR